MLQSKNFDMGIKSREIMYNIAQCYRRVSVLGRKILCKHIPVSSGCSTIVSSIEYTTLKSTLPYLLLKITKIIEPIEIQILNAIPSNDF